MIHGSVQSCGKSIFGLTFIYFLLVPQHWHKSMEVNVLQKLKIENDKKNYMSFGSQTRCMTWNLQQQKIAW